MGRQPCCDGREGLKKGPWSAEEDRKLVAFISTHGHGCWREVPKLAGNLLFLIIFITKKKITRFFIYALKKQNFTRMP
eukprot:c24555_g1_i1 orf=2-232(-)